MIVADRRTKTFFQQATFKSIIGRLHPRTLTMIPFQILPWGEVRRLEPLPQGLSKSRRDDLREFQLPIPGVWRRIMASEATPGLPSKIRDKSFPARTHVIGVIDPIANPQVAYLKSELTQKGVVKNEALNVFLVSRGDTVNAFRGSVGRKPISLTMSTDGALSRCPQRNACGICLAGTRAGRSSLSWKRLRSPMSIGFHGRPFIHTAS